ncbi:hypothetical protein ACFLXL_00395 [Chloroflexota bacterium]
MEKSTISLDSPLSIMGLTIIPVVRTSINYSFFAGFSAFISKKPLALVFISPLERKAFRITGQELTLEQLLKECPEIKGSLGAE